MKIFYDYQSIFRQKVGGVSRYHYEIYKELSKMDNVMAKYRVYGSPNYYFQDVFGYKPITNYYGLRGIPYRLNRISNYCEILYGGYDIIHPTWYDQYCYNEKNKGKYVITIHDMIHELYGGFPEWEIEGKRFWIYNADKIISVSQNTKKDILTLYPDIKPEKIEVIYDGKNTLAPEEIIEDCPQEYILYVGNRSSEYKNFKILLKALKILKERNKEQMLICVGGGVLNSKEQGLIKEYGLDKYVVQRNVTDGELVYLYKHAKCFVYPSMYEGFGMPILEAFDSQCPVIVSNSSCLPEVAGNAGMYFEHNNAEELSECILKIIEDTELRKKMIKKGSVQAEKFSWTKTAEKTKKLYEELNDSRLGK